MANIAVICDREFFQPFDQRVYKEVLTLKKAGHEIEIITPHKSTKTKEIEDWNMKLTGTSGFAKILCRVIELITLRHD